MSDENKASALKVPAATQEKFPKLVAYIQKSVSTDAEERQYWVDALPVMTEDQLKNLVDILESEQKQIEQTQKTHDKNVKGITEKFKVDFDSFEYKEKKRIIKEAESSEKTKEQKGLEDLMGEIQKL